MTDKEKLKEIKKLADAMYYAAFNMTTDASLLRKSMDEYHQFIINEYHKEEPVSEEWIEELTTKLDSLSKEDFKKVFDKYAVDFNEEHTSDELEEAANKWNAKASFNPFYMTLDANGKPNGVRRDYTTHAKSFKAGAKWQKENLWKFADGDDLPEIGREVIALKGIIDITATDCCCGYEVVFAHRPDPEGYIGKSIVTGEVEQYLPKIYGKGGWNVPNITYWLDVELPKRNIL